MPKTKQDNRKCKFCNTPFVDNTFENYNKEGEWCCKDCWIDIAMVKMAFMFETIKDIENKINK